MTQFENRRSDGRRFLRLNAVPNRADDPPTKMNKLSVYERVVLREIKNSQLDDALTQTDSLPIGRKGLLRKGTQRPRRSRGRGYARSKD